MESRRVAGRPDNMVTTLSRMSWREKPSSGWRTVEALLSSAGHKRVCTACAKRRAVSKPAYSPMSRGFPPRQRGSRPLFRRPRPAPGGSTRSRAWSSLRASVAMNLPLRPSRLRTGFSRTTMLREGETHRWPINRRPVAEPHASEAPTCPWMIWGAASGLGDRLEQGLDQASGLRLSPIPGPDHHAGETALAVDEVRSRGPPYAPLPPGHVPALIEEDGGNVAPLLHGTLDQIGALPDVYQQDLETSVLELAIDLVDGR
jgi:hypothetical protein